MSRFMPDFREDADPAVVRQCLDYSYGLLDAAKEMRQEMAAQGASLRERISAAGIQQEIEDAIDRLHRWLKRHARRGAGRSPASAEGTSMAHGCAAPASAVGPASTGPQADITLSC